MPRNDHFLALSNVIRRPMCIHTDMSLNPRWLNGECAASLESVVNQMRRGDGRGSDFGWSISLVNGYIMVAYPMGVPSQWDVSCILCHDRHLLSEYDCTRRDSFGQPATLRHKERNLLRSNMDPCRCCQCAQVWANSYLRWEAAFARYLRNYPLGLTIKRQAIRGDDSNVIQPSAHTYGHGQRPAFGRTKCDFDGVDDQLDDEE